MDAGLTTKPAVVERPGASAPFNKLKLCNEKHELSTNTSGIATRPKSLFLMRNPLR